MKQTGWVLLIISVLVIWINFTIAESNKKKFNDSPFETIFTGGANLTPHYEFWPPDEPFEILIIGCGILGLALICWKTKSDE